MTRPFPNAAECWKTILADPAKGFDLLPTIKQFAESNTDPTDIVFGTSGWRGETGSDFTVHNVRIVASAIAEVLKTTDPTLQKALGLTAADEARQRGVVVGHDNRFLGPEFASEVMAVLGTEGIPAYYAGEATTPELSACISRLGAASSINLSPSHNPANWSGLKFNPRDGGPAGTEITTAITEATHRISRGPVTLAKIPGSQGLPIDSLGLYREFLAAQGLVDLVSIRRFLLEADVLVVVDHVHGSSRGRPAALLGHGPWLRSLRTEDDQLFGGVAPEPSAENLRAVVKTITASDHRFSLGVIMDPDGDRIRFTDGNRDITMNHFGALALHFLHKHKGRRGGLVKSVATSNFGNAVAEGLGLPIHETAVGFKNFRPYMLPDAPEKALVSYEESDGISAFGNTLEKDATFGLLLALEMMATTGLNLSDYLKEVETEFGAFYPERSGIEVDRASTGPILKEKLSAIAERCRPGNTLLVGSETKAIQGLITVDGTKVVFEDGSWFLIRPSGTEPKVRFYVESRTPEETQTLVNLAADLTREAVES